MLYNLAWQCAAARRAVFSFELPGVVVVVLRGAPQIVIAFLIGTLACVGHRGSGKLPAS